MSIHYSIIPVSNIEDLIRTLYLIIQSISQYKGDIMSTTQTSTIIGAIAAPIAAPIAVAVAIVYGISSLFD